MGDRDTTSTDRNNLLKTMIGAESPQARAEAGQAINDIGDMRPGVGLRNDGLPDIVWSAVIEPDTYPIGDEEAWFPLATESHKLTYRYQIAKYPVTNAQFQAFIDADADGYNNPRYWTTSGLTWKGDRRAPDEYDDALFRLPNHPRICARWYEAMAFCGWLTERYREAGLISSDTVIRLPLDKEWEIAGRGKQGLRYPYGDAFDAAKGNTVETEIGRPCAVGLFPEGESWCGALDMSGNVWEWCLNPYEEPEGGLKPENIQSAVTRVARGGAWLHDYRDAPCASRASGEPDVGSYYVGFRVVCLSD
jgi:formylglycine-generating enzyme required for sulfatase activity